MSFDSTQNGGHRHRARQALGEPAGMPSAFAEAHGLLEGMVGKPARFVIAVASGGGPIVAYGAGTLRPPKSGGLAPQEEEGSYFSLRNDDSVGFYLPDEGVWEVTDYGGAVEITIDNCKLSVWTCAE